MPGKRWFEELAEKPPVFYFQILAEIFTALLVVALVVYIVTGKGDFAVVWFWIIAVTCVTLSRHHEKKERKNVRKLPKD
jgi:uncharacterized membrane protein YuzA (DUF378 family)